MGGYAAYSDLLVSDGSEERKQYLVTNWNAGIVSPHQKRAYGKTFLEDYSSFCKQ